MYILYDKHHNVLYLGVTSNLKVRVYQTKTYPNSFTARYNCNKLVCFEAFSTIEEAIAREKNIKNWKREWKDELINKINPKWEDLSDCLD